jgi:hypothetical protein
MKKSVKVVLGIILLIILTILVLHFLIGSESLELKEAEFTKDVRIVNRMEEHPSYDDIVYSGLEGLAIENVGVVITGMDKGEQRRFEELHNVSLDAYIIPSENNNKNIFTRNQYLIVLSTDLSLRNAIKVISHELIHLQQLNSGRLRYEGVTAFWEGSRFAKDANLIPYRSRPWENEAFALDDLLYDLILSDLRQAAE